MTEDGAVWVQLRGPHGPVYANLRTLVCIGEAVNLLGERHEMPVRRLGLRGGHTLLIDDEPENMAKLLGR